jgi:protein SCO1/2
MLSLLRTRTGRILTALALTATLLAACGEKSVSFNATDITGANYGHGFELVDSHGRLRTMDDFSGEVVMIYFGFIQCPDVCPTALMRAVEVKDALGPLGDKFRVVYITVDPERDTPEIVSAYLAAFDPEFVGLHPTMDELPDVAKSFRVFYRKVPTGDSYTMDHTASSFVFDPQGRLRLVVSHAMEVAPIAEDVRTLLQNNR